MARVMVWLVILMHLSLGTASPTIQYLSTLNHSIDGDVIIGMLTNVYGIGNPVCNDDVSVGSIQYMLAALYGLQKINSNPNLLGNIKLGLNILEECDVPMSAVAQALSLVSRSKIENLDKLGLQTLDDGADQQIMIGIVGPTSSATSMPVSNLLGIFDIPLISPAATSDTLSNRKTYPNFFRMVPPDKFQTKVMVDLFTFLNWTYISVVHAEDLYGYNSLTYIRRHCRKAGICVADAFPISSEFEDEDYEELVTKVSHVPNANVVAVFGFSGVIRGILQAAYRLEIHHIIWILPDAAYAGLVAGTGEASRGSFLVDWNIPVDESYMKFVKTYSLERDITNPYIQTTWPVLDPEQCPAGAQSLETPKCWASEFGEMSSFWFSSSTYFVTESMYVYANALDVYLREKCPEALTNPGLVKTCYKQEDMVSYLNKVSIDTMAGEKAFDEEGGMDLDFRIRQVQDEVHQVGVWRRQTADIELSRPLLWRGENPKKIPESVCAKPCQPGEFYIQGELPCCWECHRCRDNEIVSDNDTTCEPCRPLTWPDNDTFTECVEIDPSYMQWDDVFGLGLTCLAGVGLALTLVLIYVVLKHRNRRVIKGATWPMLLLILSGVGLAFADVILFIAMATDALCICNRMLFSLSCTFIFSPLLMKTHRVYLVFRASSKLTRVSRLAAASVQYTLTSLLLLIQCGLLASSAILWPIHASLTMPIITTPYVELSCSQPQEGLLIPLSFNLLLLLLCSLIAFLTRRLPDNFNESWYIFLTVTTTLFVWIAFLPTYYAAFYAFHKAALLGLALVLSGMVTTVCLFSPKLYALYFIDDKDIKITDFSTTSFEAPTLKTQVDLDSNNRF